MSNTFQVGKQYKLAGTPITDKEFKEALDNILTLPEVWTCHGTREGGCWSHTGGVLFIGNAAQDDEGWFVATDKLLEDGTVVEVSDAS